MKQPTCSPNRLNQSGKEHIPVIVVSEDPLLSIPTTHHVVGCSRKLNSNLSRHA
jgi:hypothetical protein